MTKILLFLIASPAFAQGPSAGLKLQGFVPLKAHVQIQGNTQKGLLVATNQSSKELKFEISRRAPASVVTVSAP